MYVLRGYVKRSVVTVDEINHNGRLRHVRHVRHEDRDSRVSIRCRNKQIAVVDDRERISEPEYRVERGRLIQCRSRHFEYELKCRWVGAVALIPVQLDCTSISPIAAVESIYGDLVNGTGYCIKGDYTGLHNARIYIIVLPNGYQVIDSGSRVNAERRVVVTPGRVDSDTGADWG